ncbi:hypothetical protein CVT26_016008 [Gymnopilus dilepis]|uniref:LamG-like jellyroll fold domain-containing protein n=1 Tax=Gymnopilus dilepis TaxID=231916 RepID=A0A409YDL0_9AGAR|nr:hypothetical protein CVT26_016008 [Gymnopilus dilepis]
MRFLLFTISAVLLRVLMTSAQANPGPTWSFPLRLSMGGGAYKTEPDISFVNDTLYPTVNLRGSFTILGWLRPSDTTWWRTFVSIESPDCDTSLLNVALPPNSMEIYFAYMVNRRLEDRVNVFTRITAPGPNVEFHFAIAKSESHFSIYVNGVQQQFNYALQGQIFNPSTKYVVLGRTKYQNLGGSQWNGLIHGMDIFNRTLTAVRARYQHDEVENTHAGRFDCNGVLNFDLCHDILLSRRLGNRPAERHGPYRSPQHRGRVGLELPGPFSILGWFRVSDRRFWRAAISVESPDANSALFRIALPPDQMMFNIAWMRSPAARGGAINTTAVAPGPNVNFHFALVKDDNEINIYVDGVRRATHSLSSQVFNPETKQIVLGRTKLDGNPNRSQWNGVIRDVYVFDTALTRAQVLQERQDTRRGD